MNKADKINSILDKIQERELRHIFGPIEDRTLEFLTNDIKDDTKYEWRKSMEKDV